jgi:hypothetical protein
MLNRRHCPHTGIANFFTDADPLLAVGSVARTKTGSPYHWWCYLGVDTTCGAAPDMRTAERRLLGNYRKALSSVVTDSGTAAAA